MTTTTTKTIFFKFGLSIPQGEEVEVLEADTAHENYFKVRRKKSGTIIYTVHRKNLKL